ncbi:hypothetical protein GGR01_002535 [Acetobacter oeni]|nr:hypothetical protein [Acetobacter oeni]
MQPAMRQSAPRIRSGRGSAPAIPGQSNSPRQTRLSGNPDQLFVEELLNPER